MAQQQLGTSFERCSMEPFVAKFILFSFQNRSQIESARLAVSPHWPKDCHNILILHRHTMIEDLVAVLQILNCLHVHYTLSKYQEIAY